MTRATEHDTDRALRECVQDGLNSIQAQFEILSLYPRLARLLAEGQPVAVEQLAAAGDWTPERVRAELIRLSAEWDELGQIVGLGLTLRPTRHKFTSKGADVYGWCASDALTFPIVLGRPGVVESKCPVTGQTIRVELTPTTVSRVDPADAVVSKVRPSHKVANLRVDICGLGLFFSSRSAAAEWLSRTPEGRLNSVAEDFQIHRQIVQECGWAATTEMRAP